MKKFILSVFFLLGLFATNNVAAQSTSSSSEAIVASDFEDVNSIIEETRALLPTLYSELHSMDSGTLSYKQKLKEISLFKVFASDVKEGRPMVESYIGAITTFNGEYSTEGTLWQSQKLSIMENFNEIVLN